MQSFFNQGAAGEIRFRDSALKPHSGGPPRTAAQMKEIVKAYYADISCLDEQVGQLIAHLKTSGLYDNTVVIYLSDNGYHLGNHGLGNKITMHEESVRVPAFVHSPLLPVKGAKSDALVSSLDIFPTLLEWAGIPVPTQLMGRSLRPILRDPTSTVRDHVISECVGPPDTRVGTGHRMVRTERYKYMLSSSDEEAFFDLREDPFELVDRLADAGLHTEIERHRRLLRSWMTAVGEKRLPPIPPVTPPRRPTKSQTPTGD